MGTKVTIGSWVLTAQDISVTEEATPLAAGDGSGSVGSFSLTIPEPDPHLEYTTDSAMKALNTYGYNVLLNKPIQVDSTRWGFTLGYVRNGARVGDGTIRLECVSFLGDLNVYNTRAIPFVGTLGGLFEYYLSLANISTFSVDPLLQSRPMAVMGWEGELWYHLKMLCAAEACEIALVDGVIALRPNRVEVTAAGFETEEGQNTPLPNLARAVEVYKYNTHAITQEPIYPPGGWTREVKVLNVNAGETQEYIIELGASVSSFVPPTMQTFVGKSDTGSVYTVIGNDGLPVSPAAWSSRGGSVTFVINPDTVTMTVTLTGATGLPSTEGGPLTQFSLSLADDSTLNGYSTLRLRGTGVAFEKVAKRIPTGVPASETGTEIGVTIDNPFIGDNDRLYRAGIRAAAVYAGAQPTLSGTVLTSFVPTDNTFGRVNGARVFDRSTARFYRVRSATIAPDTIQYTADDDLTVGDMDEYFFGLTVGDVDDIYAGLTVGDVNLVGMRGR